MEWFSFTIGLLTAATAYAVLKDGEDLEEEVEVGSEEENEVPINESQTRHVILSCQTCRKQKKHKELEPDLFQCVKCKRHVDLRRAS